MLECIRELGPVVRRLDDLLAEEGVNDPQFKVCADSAGQGFGVAYQDDEETNEALRRLRGTEKMEQLLREGVEVVDSYSTYFTLERDRFYSLANSNRERC